MKLTPRAGLNAATLDAFAAKQVALFIEQNPTSQTIARRCNKHWLFGAPLHWMNDWSTPFSLHVKHAHGTHVTDVDNHQRIDFCLGDTGAMFGHANQAVVSAIQKQMALGCTTMLATEDAAWVGEELARRFKLPFWQSALSASDANRFLLRWVRAATKRKKIIVFNGCYHGTVDDVFVDLVDGNAVQRDSLLGQVHELTQYTTVIEFNDIPALETALAAGDVAAVLAEPVMTNIGMVLPNPDYWVQAQTLIKAHGAKLILDETHTLSSGPGGYAVQHGLVPDALVFGKPIGGGIACAVYGFSDELARAAMLAKQSAPQGHSGIGTTLTGNMLTMAAIKATLSQVATDAAFTHMIHISTQIAQGLQRSITKHRLAWCVTQVGARCEFQFCASAPQNGSQANLILDPDLEHLIHIALLNRGVMITPFHNMLLSCPATMPADVDQLLIAFDAVLTEITN